MGPTHVRQPLVPLALAAVVLVTGCGDERPSAVRVASTPSAAAPTQTTSPSLSTGSLADFPLDLGYPDENGDDHSPVRVTETPAQTAFGLCGRAAWDPHAGTTGLIGVEFRGEAEWARGRTLVLYPSEDAAAAAVTAAHDAIAGCPDEPGEEGYGTTHDLLDIPLGDQSVVWTDTYWSTSEGEHLHDTGLTVYHVVRVGRAVLACYEYGEGNGSEESRERSVAAATQAELGVVDAMRGLPTGSGQEG